MTNLESAARSEAETAPIAEPRRRRALIVAGEASGDIHGADLVREILALNPRCEISGIAGQHMRAAGVHALYDTEDIAGLGITELRSTIGLTVGAFRTLRRILRNERPDLLILIDYAEFNVILAGTGKRAGVPVLYYVTPQVWAWRRRRVRKIINRTDRLAVVLPFEVDFYTRKGSRNASFVGHPLLDRVKPAQGRAETLARHNLKPDSRLLALLPGSRKREVRYLLKPMIDAARILARRNGLVPCLALAHTISLAELRAQALDLSGIHVIQGDTYSIVAASELALVASGTATLETALLECPMVIAYKMASVTYFIARLLVTGVDYIGMPNILAGKRVAPELIQGQVTGEQLAAEGSKLLEEPKHSETIRELGAIRALLGKPGAAARVARIALEMMA